MERDVFILTSGRLKRKNNTLYLEDKKGLEHPLPVEQTSNIHFFGQIDFNTSLLHLLSKHHICLHTYNYYGYYDGTYVPRSSKVSGHLLVQQCAHVLDSEKRLYLAKSFVSSGLYHMMRNLRKSGVDTKVYVDTLDSYKPLVEGAETVSELMGIEGKCRNVYYDSYKVLLKKDFSWTSRSKRPPQDPVNAMISFGNSLMYTTVLSEIYKTALDPTVSFLHEPSTKRFSLSLDLSEIFKPLLVDPIIFSLVNNRRISEAHFDFSDSAVYLNEEGRKRFLLAFDEKMKTTFKHRKLKRKVSYRYLIRLESYKLIKHLIGDEQYKPFKAWW